MYVMSERIIEDVSDFICDTIILQRRKTAAAPPLSSVVYLRVMNAVTFLVEISFSILWLGGCKYHA